MRGPVGGEKRAGVDEQLAWHGPHHATSRRQKEDGKRPTRLEGVSRTSLSCRGRVFSP